MQAEEILLVSILQKMTEFQIIQNTLEKAKANSLDANLELRNDNQKNWRNRIVNQFLFLIQLKRKQMFNAITLSKLCKSKHWNQRK